MYQFEDSETEALASTNQSKLKLSFWHKARRGFINIFCGLCLSGGIIGIWWKVVSANGASAGIGVVSLAAPGLFPILALSLLGGFALVLGIYIAYRLTKKNLAYANKLQHELEEEQKKNKELNATLEMLQTNSTILLNFNQSQTALSETNSHNSTLRSDAEDTQPHPFQPSAINWSAAKSAVTVGLTIFAGIGGGIWGSAVLVMGVAALATTGVGLGTLVGAAIIGLIAAYLYYPYEKNKQKIKTERDALRIVNDQLVISIIEMQQKLIQPLQPTQNPIAQPETNSEPAQVTPQETETLLAGAIPKLNFWQRTRLGFKNLFTTGRGLVNLLTGLCLSGGIIGIWWKIVTADGASAGVGLTSLAAPGVASIAALSGIGLCALLLGIYVGYRLTQKSMERINKLQEEVRTEQQKHTNLVNSLNTLGLYNANTIPLEPQSIAENSPINWSAVFSAVIVGLSIFAGIGTGTWASAVLVMGVVGLATSGVGIATLVAAVAIGIIAAIVYYPHAKEKRELTTQRNTLREENNKLSNLLIEEQNNRIEGPDLESIPEELNSPLATPQHQHHSTDTLSSEQNSANDPTEFISNHYNTLSHKPSSRTAAPPLTTENTLPVPTKEIIAKHTLVP